MKLQEYEMVDRYLYYLCRYLPYDEQIHATEDFIRILEERLPTFYTQDDIKTQINRMGHPYSFATQYNTKGGIFISGKNYELFIIFLRILTISALVGLGAFFFNYFVRLQRLNFIDLFSLLALTVFSIAILCAWITEKVKTTKILTSLMGTWNVERLYQRKKTSLGLLRMFYIVCYASLFFTLILYIKTGDYPRMTQAVVAGFFFLNILRDMLYSSEASYNDTVIGFSYLVDLVTVVGFVSMMQTSIPSLNVIYLLIAFSFINVAEITYQLLLDKKWLSPKKKSSRKKGLGEKSAKKKYNIWPEKEKITIPRGQDTGREEKKERDLFPMDEYEELTFFERDFVQNKKLK